VLVAEPSCGDRAKWRWKLSAAILQQCDFRKRPMAAFFFSRLVIFKIWPNSRLLVDSRDGRFLRPLKATSFGTQAMKLRTLLACALVMPFGLAATAHSAAMMVPGVALEAVPAAAIEQVPATRAEAEALPLVLAQITDPRVAQLEEQMRQLMGRVEELTFQILQMQDQMQRTQEDNEFRFQELEGGTGSGGGGGGSGGTGTNGSLGTGGTLNQGQAPSLDTDTSGDFAALPGVEEGGSRDLGAPPREFGTIVFNSDGSVREVTRDDSAIAFPQEGAPGQAGADQTTVAALPTADSADELYRNSYEYVLSGDYSTAEAGFRNLIDRFPGAELEPDAHFWLGESLLAQQRPREAAEVFLAASRNFPQSSKAPEILYKLGVSLIALDQRDVACATLAEVSNRFPNASDALKERVRQERAQAAC
jgi:tol-pal system protein YbgF